LLLVWPSPITLPQPSIRSVGFILLRTFSNRALIWGREANGVGDLVASSRDEGGGCKRPNQHHVESTPVLALPDWRNLRRMNPAAQALRLSWSTDPSLIRSGKVAGWSPWAKGKPLLDNDHSAPLEGSNERHDNLERRGAFGMYMHPDPSPWM
jgi:hypothetical protein